MMNEDILALMSGLQILNSYEEDLFLEIKLDDQICVSFMQSNEEDTITISDDDMQKMQELGWIYEKDYYPCWLFSVCS